MTPLRLDKYLRDATTLSRSQIKQAWASGQIVVELQDGTRPQRVELSDLIFEGDRVLLKGESVVRQSPSNYYVLNKPVGVLSTAMPEQDWVTLSKWLETLDPGVFPVGRLDAQTSGVMLLIDDGDLAHVLMDPNAPISYTFHARVAQVLEEDDPRLESLSRGVELKPGHEVRANQIDIVSKDETSTILALHVSEGRSKQLRSMFNVVGLRLESLARVGVGGVDLGDLPEGQMREINEEEREKLWSLVGGQHAVEQRRMQALARLCDRLAEQGRPHERLTQWLAEQPKE